jgi:hypothetical protein
MSTTEVMIKDISDSKRIDSFIRGNDNPLRRNISESSSEEVIMRYVSNELEISYISFVMIFIEIILDDITWYCNIEIILAYS